MTDGNFQVAGPLSVESSACVGKPAVRLFCAWCQARGSTFTAIAISLQLVRVEAVRRDWPDGRMFHRDHVQNPPEYSAPLSTSCRIASSLTGLSSPPFFMLLEPGEI